MFKPKLFSRKDVRMSDAEFEKTTNSMVESGLLEKVVIDGKVFYRGTPLCCTVRAQSHSDPCLRN